jgi:hypothetical protein
MWVDEVRSGYGLLGKVAWVHLIGHGEASTATVPAGVMVQVVRQ